MASNKIDDLSIATIRLLGLETIFYGKSGHGGIVLGAAPMMYSLYTKIININPAIPDYINRDRFILSAGHGSALLYSIMCLAGFKHPSVADLKQFRKIDSFTPGHPERAITPGVDYTTGPLGQGAGASIGFAIAEKHLASIYNKYSKVIDHYTYVLLGDGCMEEGITQEAMAIAGKYQLNKLIWLYDSNDVQLDGMVSDSTQWDVKKLAEGYSWNYILVKENNPNAIADAINAAKKSTNKPTIIEVKTIIGEGSSVAGTNKAHGFKPTIEELTSMKQKAGLPAEDFYIPAEVKKQFASVQERGKKHYEQYLKNLNILKSKDAKLYQEYLNVSKNKFNFDLKWFKDLKLNEKESSRKMVGDVFSLAFTNNPSFLVVNPDISSSTRVKSNGGTFSNTNPQGQNINVGVREFIGACIVNGAVAHGGCLAACSTFLPFVDYNKAAIRLSAINEIPSLNIYSHDSITVGEDGPTHEAIEQIPALRLIPHHYTCRPYNNDEIIAYMNYYVTKLKDRPMTFIASRHEYKVINSNSKNIMKGGYVLIDESKYDLTIVATGSEVGKALEIKDLLKANKINARIVSMPCVEIFDEQDDKYQKEVLGNKYTISLELASTAPWYKYVDYPFGINCFGASGDVNSIYAKFKLDNNSIVETIKQLLKNNKK